MAIPGDDQALVEVGAVGGEDVFAVAKAAEEGERDVEDEGPGARPPQLNKDYDFYQSPRTTARTWSRVISKAG